MNQIALISLVLIGLFANALSLKADKLDCAKAELELDQKLKKLFWIGESAQIPRTEQDIDKFCLETQTLLKNAQSFRSCLGPFPKVILNVINRQIRKFGRRICTDSSRKQAALRRLRCITQENIHQLYYCPHRALVQLNYLADNSTQNTQNAIASFCCIFQRTATCARSQVQTIRSECSANGNSNKQPASSLGQLLGGLSGETTELICSRYSSLEICERDFGEGLRKLDQVADQNRIAFKDTPIVRPMLRLADQLGAKD